MEEQAERRNEEERSSLPEAKMPHEIVVIQLPPAPSTALITSIIATLIALAKELGTEKQLTLISQQVMSLKEH